MKISEKTKIKELLGLSPGVFGVFLSNGFHYSTPEELIEALGSDTMLKTILSVKELNQELFLYQIETAILKTEKERDYLLPEFEENQTLDFYGNTICPLKLTFKDKMELIIKDNQENTGVELSCFVGESGGRSGCQGDFMPDSPENFPGILLTKEFNGYLGKKFRQSFCENENFSSVSYEKIDPRIEEAEIMDPKGQYCVYAVMAEHFFVDMDRLGQLPVPETLKDLLNPIYRDNIVIFGKEKGNLSNAVFLYIYKEFGEEGLKQFAYNVTSALHGSVMSKTAGTKKAEGGAIYMVSGFFANTCTKGNLKLIWPKDGAMVLPMYFMVRRDRLEKVSPIVNYLTGDEFAASCTRAFTPPVNGNVENYGPPDGRFKWLGWDYIREHDMDQLIPYVEQVFMKYWRQYHPEREHVTCS